MYGLGHGGFESIVLVGGMMLLGIINLWSFANVGSLNSLKINEHWQRSNSRR